MAARKSVFAPASAGTSADLLPELVSVKSDIQPKFAVTLGKENRIKPESLVAVYSGDTSPARWLQEVRDICEEFEWTERHTLRVMQTRLKGDAKAYMEIAIPAGESMTFSKVAQLLELRFKPRESLVSKLLKFRSVAQERTESIPEFAARVRCLGLDTSTSNDETRAMDPKLLVAFTAGLKDLTIKQAVLLGKPQSFSEAVEMAITSRAEFGREEKSASVNAARFEHSQAQHSDGASFETEGGHNERMCDFCKKKNHHWDDCRDRLYKENLCFICKKAGCRAYKHGEKDDQSRVQTVISSPYFIL